MSYFIYLSRSLYLLFLFIYFVNCIKWSSCCLYSNKTFSIQQINKTPFNKELTKQFPYYFAWLYKKLFKLSHKLPSAFGSICFPTKLAWHIQGHASKPLRHQDMASPGSKALLCFSWQWTMQHSKGKYAATQWLNGTSPSLFLKRQSKSEQCKQNREEGYVQWQYNAAHTVWPGCPCQFTVVKSCPVSAARSGIWLLDGGKHMDSGTIDNWKTLKISTVSKRSPTFLPFYILYPT